MIDFNALTAPFKPNEIEWRVGSTSRDKSRGLALAYMDARAVMDRLDAVCGPENWQDRYTHANTKTVCEIGLRINGEWLWKADGAGDTEYEAEKGAMSDAFKRAAVRWGIGRYLYDLPAKWVAIKNVGSDQRPRYVFDDGVLEGLKASVSRENNADARDIPSGLPATKLRQKMSEILSDLHNEEMCSDAATFEGMVADNSQYLEQCARDLPKAYYGNPDNPDSIGVQKRIEDRRKALIEREQTTRAAE